MASTDAKAVPIKNAAYRVTFPILDADGDLVTGATGLDSEVSIDGGTFADATAEATEIATASGMYFLDLTAAEMNGDTIAIIVKTTSSGAKTTPLVLYTAARSINDLAFPTVTGRSLDVSAGGEAGLDWANIGSPTTPQNLSATNIDVDQVVASVSGAVGSVTGAVGSVTGAVGSVTAGVTLAADFRIKKNTALANFMFVMVDSADHITPKTGLTVTAQRSLDGAAFGSCANAVSELSNGVYKISLAAADLNADVCTLRFTASGGDDRVLTVITQTE